MRQSGRTCTAAPPGLRETFPDRAAAGRPVKPKQTMKKTLTALFVAAVAATASAQTTVTTTTVGTGTITEYAPGSTLIVTETAGPVTYRYGESVTYVTKTGRVLTAEEVKTRLRVGAPVSVTYATEGEERVVNRIEVDDDGEIEIEKD